LLQSFINLDRWEQLSLGQQGVNLFDELQCSVLLIQDQGVDVVDRNWNSSFLEKDLQLLPVVLFLCIALSIIKRVHLEILVEIPGEYFSD
jgi:hypothetical protein